MIIPMTIVGLCLLAIVWNFWRYVRNPIRTQCDHHYRMISQGLRIGNFSVDDVQKFYEFYKPLVPRQFLIKRYYNLLKLITNVGNI